MATVEQLQAEIAELKEQITMLKRLMGETGGAFRSLNIGTNSLLGPISSLVDVASSGATGLSAYNATLANTTELIGKFGSQLGTFGKILGAMGDAGGAYVQASAQQGDALYKTYQDLAAYGAAGQEKADKVTGRPEKGTFDAINDLANQFGIVSARDLPKFTQMISQSSESLAKFGGTVYDGVKAFGSLANSVQNTGLQTEFLNMGMTVDSINKGLAGYLKMQTLGAAGQMKSQQELNAGAGEYIRNLDMLSKLTGKNIETLQKEQEEALLNEQYAIHQRELEQKSAAGDMEAKKQLAEEQKVINQTEGSVRKGFMAAFTGYGMQFEEGRKLYMSAPETFNQAAKGLGVNANQLLDTAKGEFKTTMDTFGDLIKAAGNSLFLFVGDMRKIENLQGTADDREGRARELRKRQTEQTSADVAGMTSLNQVQRDATRDLTNFVSIGIMPAIHFLGQLAETARDAADLLPGAKKRTPEQQQRQGYGPQVGTTGTSGATAADIRKAASDTVKTARDNYEAKIAEVTQQIKDLEAKKAAITETAGMTEDEKRNAQATRAKIQKELDDIGVIKTNMSKFLENWNNGTRPTPPPQPLAPVTVPPAPNQRQDTAPVTVPPAPNQRQDTAPVTVPPAPNQRQSTSALPSSEVLAANIGRGIINVASAESVRFPGMQTSYTPSMSASGGDLRTADQDDTKQAMRKAFDGFTSNNVPNSDVIASNAILAGKMDELIGLMRTSGGYLQKISIKDYA